MTKFPIRLILSDIRSTHNVGSILRTADAAVVELVYSCGYTPYPAIAGDPRPPHVISDNTKAIRKTALGAELTVPVLHIPDTTSAISEAKHNGFTVIVLEQSEESLNLYDYRPTGPMALVLGNEVAGVSPENIAQADHVLEIPQLGSKESLNVSVAAALAMYHLRFSG
jgi:23S rRNA (guanosine2251-2'-O)-methyltransferase